MGNPVNQIPDWATEVKEPQQKPTKNRQRVIPDWATPVDEKKNQLGNGLKSGSTNTSSPIPSQSNVEIQTPTNPLHNQEKIFSGLTKTPTDNFGELTSTGEPPVSKIPRQPRVKTLDEIKDDFSNKVTSDETLIQKPPSQVEINDKLKREEQHKKNIDIAIDNTTKQYLKNKGIKTGTNSQIYQEQKQKVQKAFDNGDVTYHMDLKTNTPRLDKLTGFWGNLSKGWNDAMDNNDEAATFVHDMNTQQRVDYVKAKQQQSIKKEPSEYLDERAGGAGWAGNTLGGAAPFLAKAGAGLATGAALLAAAPETMGASLAAAPVAMSFIYTAPDMANQGGMNETLRRYSQLKTEHPELTDLDAMSKAESGLLTGGIAGVAEDALFMKNFKLPISNEGKQVLGKFVTESLQSGMNMGAATAAADVGKNIVSTAEGYKPKDIIKSAANTFVDNATAGMVLHGMINGVPKILNSAFKFALKDTPKEEISNILNSNVEAGNITPEQAKKTATDIDGYNEALDKINPNGLSETSQASIAGLIQAKENLKKESETKDESVRKPYDAKIEAINAQIADIQRTNKPFEHEVDDLTGNTLAKPSLDDVAKQRVEDIADKISKGKPIEDVVDVQTEAKFPDQLDKQLNKILREEKSNNKDKENPNNEITNNITKYLEKNKKEEPVGEPENISQPIELSTEVPSDNKGAVSVEPPKEIPEPIKLNEPNEENKAPEIHKQTEDISHAETKLPENPPPTEEGETGTFAEDKRTILSHRGLQEVATEHGLEDIDSREKKTDLQLYKDAGDTIDKWATEGSYPKKIEGLIKDAENKLPLSDEQRVILEQHIANVREEVNNLGPKSSEFDSRLKELQRIVKAGEATRSAAGAALRVPTMSSNPNDLSGMMVQEIEANNNAPLTENQKSTVVKEYQGISTAEKAYQEKIAGLEAENAKLRAGKKVAETKSTTPKTKKAHTDFVTERKKITESISEKLKKARGELNVVPVPYAKELIAIAPDVAKLMKSYVEEGVVKLEEITQKIFEDLKVHINDLKEKDIHDIIAGEYNEKKKTKNEISAKIENIRIQAKLVNKLEMLQSGQIPKNERNKIKRNQEIEKLREQIKELMPKQEMSDATKLKSFKTRMGNELKELQKDLQTGNFNKEVKPPIKLDKEAQELKNNLIKLRQERTLRLMKQEYANRSKRDKAIDTFSNILNIPRTIMSSMDYSALLRQSLFSATSHPRTAMLAQLEAFKQSMSQKRFDEWFYDLKDDPRYEIMQKSGLFVADPHDPRLSAKEEAFMSNLAEKIPIAGAMIKGSERAYVGTLNKMRVDLFNRFAERFEAQGKTFENNPDFYKELANYINNSTGRGKLGFLETAAPVLNSIFFSPRLIASRINLMTMWMNPRFYTKVPPEVRTMYMKDMLKFIGVGMSVLALAKLNGAQVEDDPRSSDFGKIKDGNTRYDIWGGFQPYVRVVSQIASGEKKSTVKGTIKELNGKQAFGETKSDVIERFGRGKLAPVPSMVWDFLSGRTVTGDKPTLSNEAESHLLPLLYSDVKDAYKDGGIQALFKAVPASTFGIGVNTYLPINKPNSKKERPLNKEKQMKPEKNN